MCAPVTRFNRELRSCRWVAYAPSQADPPNGRWASRESIRSDLKVLRDCGFDGVVTYGCVGSGAEIPRLARAAGIRGVICGVWNPADSAEIAAAIRARADVDGYCIGNEGLGSRYGLEELDHSMAEVRSQTGRPVTTTEIPDKYETIPQLYKLGDWVFPNVHPYWAGLRNADDAVAWTLGMYQRFEAAAGGKSVILKETGFPTAGDSAVGENLQARFFEKLARTSVPFVYFEAFDQPWKTWAPVESHWGLFRADRTPKQAAGMLRRGRSS